MTLGDRSLWIQRENLELQNHSWPEVVNMIDAEEDKLIQYRKRDGEGEEAKTTHFG